MLTMRSPARRAAIGDIERDAVAYCTKSGRGTRTIPNGTLKGVHFVKTPEYVQITGVGNFTKINVPKGDSGGELDNRGADGMSFHSCWRCIPIMPTLNYFVFSRQGKSQYVIRFSLPYFSHRLFLEQLADSCTETHLARTTNTMNGPPSSLTRSSAFAPASAPVLPPSATISTTAWAAAGCVPSLILKAA